MFIQRTFIQRYFFLLAVCLAILSLVACHGADNIGMLNPKGLISYEERKLFFDTLALMLIVVLPVIVMSFTFIYHYQASHRIREYKPNWSHNYFLEALWWGIPCVIILVLAILTWKKTHTLDPYHKITEVDQKPMIIEVIALPWKWLFIYPQQNLATVNYLMIPAGQEVEFWITTDNVAMSAFFIPQLSSQIYAMAGMRTRLHLLSNQPGEYEGLNALYNGGGFSEMHFKVQVAQAEQMQQWFDQMKKSKNHLTKFGYRELLNPSIGNTPQFFSDLPNNLFQDVIALYMNSLGTIHPRDQQVKAHSLQ